MIDPPIHSHVPSRRHRTGLLFLNDTLVGTVSVRGHDGSWGFGEFTPSADFVKFAPIFGRWSLLMHADEDDVRLSEAASEELRETEQAMDAIRASLLMEDPQELHPIRQLNIDGQLIEWKV